MGRILEVLHYFALVLLFASPAPGKPRISLANEAYGLPPDDPFPWEDTEFTVPPDKPCPANPSDYNSFSPTTSVRPPISVAATVENRVQETTTSQQTSRAVLDYGKPPASLEYNPFPLPSYNPNPGENTAHTVPPGKPWPANPSDYNSFSQTTSARPPVSVVATLENRLQETTTTQRPLRPNLDYGKPPASLGYNPLPLPSYNPNPGENTAHTVPPGKPWPANAQDYGSFSQSASTNQKPPPPLNQRIQETNAAQKPVLPPSSYLFPGQLIFPDDLLFTDLEFRQAVLQVSSLTPQNQKVVKNRGQMAAEVESLVVLDYDPQRPSFRPSSTEIKQRVPPGEPWPANSEEYATFGQNRPSKPNPAQQTVENRVQEISTNRPTTIKPEIVFVYKPSRPDYRPGPTETEQRVPPCSPRPANPTDNGANIPSMQQTFENRVQEITTSPPNAIKPQIVLDYKPSRPDYRPSPTETQQRVPPGNPWPANPQDNAAFGLNSPSKPIQTQQTIENRVQEMSTVSANVIKPLVVLDYKPNRPSYKPSPTQIEQKVPPGKPWPASPGGYDSFGRPKPFRSAGQDDGVEAAETTKSAESQESLLQSKISEVTGTKKQDEKASEDTNEILPPVISDVAEIGPPVIEDSPPLILNTSKSDGVSSATSSPPLQVTIESENSAAKEKPVEEDSIKPASEPSDFGKSQL